MSVLCSVVWHLSELKRLFIYIFNSCTPAADWLPGASKVRLEFRTAFMERKSRDDDDGEYVECAYSELAASFIPSDLIPLRLPTFSFHFCFCPIAAASFHLVTLTVDGGRVSWFTSLAALSRSSRKNRAVARKNIPPRTMTKGQSMRAYPKLRNCHISDVA